MKVSKYEKRILDNAVKALEVTIQLLYELQEKAICDDVTVRHTDVWGGAGPDCSSGRLAAA